MRANSMSGEALTTHASLTMNLCFEFFGRDLAHGASPSNRIPRSGTRAARTARLRRQDSATRAARLQATSGFMFG